MRFLLLIIVCVLSSFVCIQSRSHTDLKLKQSDLPVLEAKLFCKKMKMDTGLAIFVDMGIHPGKFRLFVVDLNSGKILGKSLCCHGMGKNSTELKPQYSNTCGSNCTSLGKYSIGKKAVSQYGIHIHYKLHGLEKTNNNAFTRIVVLHSYNPVPETEIFPSTPPLGWSLGCPVISNEQMSKIDKQLSSRKNSVLLWIFDSSQSLGI